MTINLLTTENITVEMENQMVKLFKQLNPGLQLNPLAKIMEKKNQLSLVYCQEGDQIIGMASMCTYNVFSGSKGIVEDVVVDTAYRGRGLGRQLMEKLLTIAEQKGLTEVLLFTGNHRQSAIRLYTKLGFEKSQSGMYRLKLDQN
ncbi:GNAT family N-acetyltransferase [Flagellimonas pacifica]|uniref:Acetyltransferase (GNAT) family protein n=1 Tax=Flagellimonas pacifica TaxID=1247520 RepID=A0A285MDE6_9FLAO|nr:GNAT family N-acetyltransferase [Allomuricauda parva]SNY94723.1 Acetyltransferase (GNAT) family protein [Allomuricauda parva]